MENCMSRGWTKQMQTPAEKDRVKESWEVLTPEQVERYEKELASGDWRKYSCDRSDYEI